MEMGMKLILPLAFALLSTTAQPANLTLVGLTYHGYCPPLALQAGLCKANEDFVATPFILRPAVIGDFVVNQMLYTAAAPGTGVDGYLKLGSKIKIVYTTATRTRSHSYTLMDNLRNVIPCDLCSDPLEVTNSLGRQFVVYPDSEGCYIRVRGEWTEPDKGTPGNAMTHDATMVFLDNACEAPQ